MQIVNRVIDFISKYKLLHIAFWSWSAVSLIHIRVETFGGNWLTHLSDVIIITCTQMVCVYFVVGFLIPRYLNHSKYFTFSLLTLFCLIVTTAFNTLLLNVYNFLTEQQWLTNSFLISLTHLLDTFINTILFIAAYIITAWYKTDRRNQKLEKERLEAELNFLKAQINPHFFFNALNSIYVLMDMDRKQAGDTLIKFSDLLRYQLYECKGNDVELENELKFVTDYIALETMRSGDELKIDCEVHSVPKHFRIAPFLLMPFVENAFKHVSRSPDRNNFIRIKSIASNNTLSFFVENSYSTNGYEVGGIGLLNVRRRLELLYPNKYNLSIHKTASVYTVNLQINAN